MSTPTAITVSNQRKTFNVTLTPREVIGCFAIHRPVYSGDLAYGKNTWTVTHMPSGAKVSIVRTLADARQLVATITPMLPSWDFDNVNTRPDSDLLRLVWEEVKKTRLF